MNNIQIKFIPHARQRYNTLGDWYYNGEDLIICVSNDCPEISTRESQQLVALHELVEALLCAKRGITQEQVDTFDMNFIREDEPGDDPLAPYRQEHRQAMIIEHLMANFMGFTSYGVIK
jgi:hypothetical protein